MKYRWSHCSVHLLLIMLIWLTGSLGISLADQPPGSEEVQRLLIVTSSDNPFFHRTIEQLRQRLEGRPTRIATLLSKDIEQQREQLEQADLIITLGARAMRQVSGLHLRRPLLHAYLTRYQYLSDPPLPDSHSLLLDQPLQRYLRFNRLLTGARRIGMLNLPATAFSEDELRKLGNREQVELVQKVIEPGHGNPVAAVRQILQKTDNLLAIPAPEIYNRKTLKGILLAAYRLRKPLISYSPAHVRAGALGALYATPEQIGDQIADIAVPWLQGKPPPEPYSLARYFDIGINRQVASALGITPPDTGSLRQALSAGGKP